MAIVKSIKLKGKQPQKCITIKANDGLFVLSNKLVTHNSDAFIMRTYNDTKARVSTRMKGNYFGRTIIDSSPNTLESPIDDYICNQAKKDPLNYIVKGSQWKWAPEDFDLTKTFGVYTGGKGQPPKILDKEEEDNFSPEKIIQVPQELYQFFKDDLYKSLKDRAGIPAGSADMLIYDHQKIENIFNPNLKNLYTHITASEEEVGENLIWNQISPTFFKWKANKQEFWYKPWLPRCVSVDQSITGDVTCIAMTHTERDASTGEEIAIVDFTVVIAPQGKRINIDAIRYFIKDLRDIGNMNLSHVSYDSFQSEPSLQYLRNKGFKAERLSVDSPPEAYLFLLSLINKGHIQAGRNLYIKNNLKALKAVTEKNGKEIRMKIDHDDSQDVITTGTTDWNKSLIGAFAKDSTDAIAGSIALNRKYYPNPTDIWDPNYLIIAGDTVLQRKNAETEVSAFLKKLGVH